MQGKTARYFAGLALIIPGIVAAAGTWTTDAPPPIGGLFTSPSPVLNGKIYLVGPTAPGPDPTNTPTQIYDIATASWTTDNPVGFVSAGLTAEIGGKIYYAGGCSFSDCNSPTKALRIFDPATHLWTNGAPMPTARGAVAGGGINGKLYVTTGTTNSSATVPANSMEIYDPATDSWSMGAPLPQATSRRNATSVVLGNQLYVIAGGSDVALTDRVDVYDSTTDTWTQEQPIPEQVYAAGGAVLNGRIHIFGGNDSNSSVNTHYVFDPATHQWTLEAPMPTRRWALTGAAAGSTIYAIGGAQDGYNYTSVNETFSETPPPPLTPTSKDECKNDGWKSFGIFKNQGNCVSFVNHLN